MRFEKDTVVKLGEPAVYPTEFIAHAIAILKKYETVKSAYLWFIHHPDKQLPNYLVTLDAGESHKEVVKEMGPLVLEYLPNQVVDFMTLNVFEHPSDKKPFYKR